MLTSNWDWGFVIGLISLFLQVIFLAPRKRSSTRTRVRITKIGSWERISIDHETDDQS